jgi:hypothetical protein
LVSPKVQLKADLMGVLKAWQKVAHSVKPRVVRLVYSKAAMMAAL